MADIDNQTNSALSLNDRTAEENKEIKNSVIKLNSNCYHLTAKANKLMAPIRPIQAIVPLIPDESTVPLSIAFRM